MKRALALVAVLASLSASTGCFHYRTELPGVLDLRTDASLAAPREEPLEDPYAQRSGFGSVIEGHGVDTLGTGVVVEDRHYYLLRLFSIYNRSSTEELEQALGSDGALRDLTIGDGFAPEDIALASAGSLVPGIGGVLLAVLPPMTFTLSGVRVQAARQPTKGQVRLPTPPPAAAPLPLPGPEPEPETPTDENGATP